MTTSSTLGFIVLQDCLEDATYAIEAGNDETAAACLKTARQNLRSLVMELVTAKSRIEELEKKIDGLESPDHRMGVFEPDGDDPNDLTAEPRQIFSS